MAAGGGLDVRVDPPNHEHPARVVLTNLAGHSYPAGTHRRSLRVEVQYDDDPKTRVLLARLKVNDPVPATHPYQPVLGSGDERPIDIRARENAATVSGAVR